MSRTKYLNKVIFFASGNIDKFNEIKVVLSEHNIQIQFFKQKFIEIQSDICEIAIQKARDAYNIIQKPVLVEDDGLFIEELNGFPGQYSSFIYETIGNEGVLKLMKDIKNRKAVFMAVIAYFDNNTEKYFTGEIEGKIALKKIGDGWGYDPIFIPDGTNFSFGQLHDNGKKYQISHRFKAVKKFCNWYNLNRN